MPRTRDVVRAAAFQPLAFDDAWTSSGRMAMTPPAGTVHCAGVHALRELMNLRIVKHSKDVGARKHA